MAAILRLRKDLSGQQAEPSWPAGYALVPLASVQPSALHAILENSYRTGFGSVPAFDEWWPAVTGDSEFDPSLVFVAVNRSGEAAGLALCWNSGFIKDIAVAEAHRGKGLGEALLRTAFRTLASGGSRHVDLKVQANNSVALRLYRRVGMVEAAL